RAPGVLPGRADQRPPVRDTGLVVPNGSLIERGGAVVPMDGPGIADPVDIESVSALHRSHHPMQIPHRSNTHALRARSPASSSPNAKSGRIGARFGRDKKTEGNFGIAGGVHSP